MSTPFETLAGSPDDATAALPLLALYRDYREGIELIESWIRRKAGARTLRVLEAGCGNKWPLKLEGVSYSLTAVDLDSRALAIRREKLRDGDRLMEGDLRERALLADGTFDVVYNSFVLEHVPGAEEVLRNFIAWLAPGGLMILRVPDRNSVYGFCTRVTPLWLHVLYKKYVQGMKNAGKPGYDPYPTYYDEVISRAGIRRFCAAHGCRLKVEAGNADYLPRTPLRRAATGALVRMLSMLSLGRLDWRHNNLTFVIEKNAATE